MIIEYKITVMGSEHTVTEEIPDEDISVEAFAHQFCRELATAGFHYEQSWWAPWEVARVDWRVLDAT